MMEVIVDSSRSTGFTDLVSVVFFQPEPSRVLPDGKDHGIKMK
jgi:hypothetical protein